MAGKPDPSGRAAVAKMARELAATCASAALRGRAVAIAVCDPKVDDALRQIHFGAQALYDCSVEIGLGLMAIVYGPDGTGKAREILFAGTAAVEASRAAAAAKIREPVVAAKGPELAEQLRAGTLTPEGVEPAPTPELAPIVEDLDALLAAESEADRAEAEELPPPAPEGGPLDRSLRALLTRYQGSAARWEKRRAQGCTDEDLRSAIRTEIPARAEDGPGVGHPGYSARGGSDPAFFLGGWSKGKRADLKGDDLIRAVRRVMAIPTPTEPASRPKRVRKPRPSRAAGKGAAP